MLALGYSNKYRQVEKLKRYLGDKMNKTQGWTKYQGKGETGAKPDTGVSISCNQMDGGPLTKLQRAQEEDKV